MAQLLLAAGCASAHASESLPAEVRLRTSGAGNYLTDTRGYSLYLYAQDNAPGKSACANECAKNWPPLVASAAAVAIGEFEPIERADGGRQWTWRGRPLYSYAKDAYAGARFGDGVGNAWRVALQLLAMPPGFAVRSTYLGRLLTDARGHTLYWRRDESSAPRRDSQSLWMPQVAPWLARAQGDWSLLARDDGERQWALRGRRLYAYAEDLKPGDAAGQGVDAAWEVAVLDPAPALPDWVTIQNSDMGEVYADQRGHTLYVFQGQLERTRQLLCNDECIRRFWRTLPAPRDARPTGDFAPLEATDVTPGRVWAYRGNVLYTHTRDVEPGAVGGDKWAAGVGGGGGGWTPLTRRRDLEE